MGIINSKITQPYWIALQVGVDLRCFGHDHSAATSVSHIFPSGDYGSLTIKGPAMSVHAASSLILQGNVVVKY